LFSSFNFQNNVLNSLGLTYPAKIIRHQSENWMMMTDKGCQFLISDCKKISEKCADICGTAFAGRMGKYALKAEFFRISPAFRKY